MQRYDCNDLVTLYLIIYEDDRGKIVQAWSDDKYMAKLYMEFHSCKRMRLKIVEKNLEEAMVICNENNNDEIQICNLTVHNTGDRKKGKPSKIIQAPMTMTELSLVNDEVTSFMGNRINYSLLEEWIPCMKSKYQKALKQIFLTSVINKAMHEKSDRFTESVVLDELMVLFRNYNEYFD